MSLSQDALSIIALGALGAAIIAIGIAVMLTSRLNRMRQTTALLQGGHGTEDFVTAVGRQVEAARSLSEQVAVLHQAVVSLEGALQLAVQRVGLVRFDAFEDMGGHLSFSAALLDARGDGVVFSAINGRADGRIYAKPVAGGTSRHNLSEEELEAIRRALGTGAP